MRRARTTCRAFRAPANASPRGASSGRNLSTPVHHEDTKDTKTRNSPAYENKRCDLRDLRDFVIGRRSNVSQRKKAEAGSHPLPPWYPRRDCAAYRFELSTRDPPEKTVVGPSAIRPLHERDVRPFLDARTATGEVVPAVAGADEDADRLAVLGLVSHASVPSASRRTTRSPHDSVGPRRSARAHARTAPPPSSTSGRSC